MKLKISLIIFLFLIIFALSCKREYFQNNFINMPKGFLSINGNFFSQGETPVGTNAVQFDPDTVSEKYGKFSDISLDKKNMIVKQGYHVRKQLCLDNYCIDGNDISKFDEDKKIPRFYKKCVDYQRPLNSNESITTQATGEIDTSNVEWRDSRGNCDHYKDHPEKCINAESFTPTSGDFKGISAKDACCACKSSTKNIDGVMYEESVYNQNNKNIPNLLCSRSKSAYKIVVSGASNNIFNGTYKSQGTYNNATFFQNEQHPQCNIKYETFENMDHPLLDWKKSIWFLSKHNEYNFILLNNQSNLKWLSTYGDEELDFNGIENENDEDELCISGQELRILNGSKSINIKSDWDYQNDYIRPYNTQYGDGNNNSGLRDYIFYQKDNDVLGIAEDKTKALTRGKDNIQRIETCKKHVSSKPNCLSGNITYEKIGDSRAQIVYEDKWIIRYGSANLYYNDNSSDLSNVPTSGWKYNKSSFILNWGDGRYYRGTQNRARNGATCQNWTSQSPHGHSRTPWNYPNFGLGHHNYCRNPDGEPDIWCYTNWGGRWEFCDPNTITVRRLNPYRPPGGTGENDLKQISISGHSIGDGKNINGIYREVKIEGHYCEDSGKAASGADYGLEYIILPGKKDDDTLTAIDNYTHIHDHSHSKSRHIAL